MKDKSLSEIFLDYKPPTSRQVALKMLQEVRNSTPAEIGATILRSKRQRQTILNLEFKH